MIMDHMVVQDPGFMGRVMVEVILVEVFRAIKAIRATKVVITNREINNSSSRVIKVTRSSSRQYHAFTTSLCKRD